MVTCQVCPGHISSFNIIKHTSKFIIITSKVWSHLKHQLYKDLAHCRAAFRIDWSREALLSSRFVRSFFTINVTDLVRQTMEEKTKNDVNDRNFFQPYLDVDSKSVDPTGWKNLCSSKCHNLDNLSEFLSNRGLSIVRGAPQMIIGLEIGFGETKSHSIIVFCFE